MVFHFNIYAILHTFYCLVKKSIRRSLSESQFTAVTFSLAPFLFTNSKGKLSKREKQEHKKAQTRLKKNITENEVINTIRGSPLGLHSLQEQLLSLMVTFDFSTVYTVGTCFFREF